MTTSIELTLEVANRENTKKIGWFIGEHKEKAPPIGGAGGDGTNGYIHMKQTPCTRDPFHRSSMKSSMKEVKIPFYDTVREGADFDEADWKDQACVRQAVISWRDDLSVKWLERHMEMTQGFICIGDRSPGLFVLGEPTHDREDLDEKARARPDLTRLKAFIIPPGCGIIIKKGVWHDFPVSCGPPLTVVIINTEEVVEALTSMEEPGPMNHGDCYKLRLSDEFQNVEISFEDPRPFVMKKAMVARDAMTSISDDILPHETKLVETNGKEGYGRGMSRSEVGPSWGLKNGVAAVYVIPVVNVEVFTPGKGGPAIQPHLQSKPELANKGWRDSGNKNGLNRLVSIFKKLGVPATAVVNSDAVGNHEDIAAILHNARSEGGWEIAAHGTNNSTGFASLSKCDEAKRVEECIDVLTRIMGRRPTSWLSPGFSVTVDTPEILANAGIEGLLDFVDDEIPYRLTNPETKSETICIPYSMETNDFSLVLGRHLSPREYAGALQSHVEQLADEAKESGKPKVVCLGLHTFVAGQAGYARELGKAIERLQGYSNESVCFTTVENIVGSIKKDEI